MINNIKKILVLGFLSLSFLLIPSCCSWFSKKEEATQAAVSDMKVKLINVNDEESFKDANIKGSIQMMFDQAEPMTKDWNKSTPIVVYCTDYACTESHRVAQELKKLGFTDVKVYKGGIQEWYQLAQNNKDAYPYEGAATQPFLKKEIVKLESDDKEIATITAEELSKLMSESKS